MGKFIIFGGLIMVGIGVAVWLLEAAGLRPGSMPGDISWRRGNSAFYFPIVTSLVLSVIASVVLYLLSGMRR